MKLIPLTQGMFTMVDDEDFDFLNQFHWQISCNGYAQRSFRTGNGYRIRFMHKDLLEYTDDLVADHINGDPLDNRRSNLRVATRSENQRNQRKQSRKTSSKYKGVYWAAYISRWRAYISPSRAVGRIYLGCFLDEDSAGRAYDVAAKKWFGEFARLNFPQDAILSS